MSWAPIQKLEESARRPARRLSVMSFAAVVVDSAGQDHCQALKIFMPRSSSAASSPPPPSGSGSSSSRSRRSSLRTSASWCCRSGSCGCCWLQLASVGMLTMGYVGHDAGHFALSRTRWVNNFWGHFGMTFLCGMSFGFWRSRHNPTTCIARRSAAIPTCTSACCSRSTPARPTGTRRSGRFFLRIQKWAFWPLSAFYWVSLRYDGMRDLFQQPDKTQARSLRDARCTGSRC